MEHVEIAIAGGGIAGASLAYFLAGRRSLAILEPEDAPGYHATGRSAAEFVLRYNAEPVNRLAALAKPFFDQPPEGFADVPLLVPRGSLILAGQERVEQLAAQFAIERQAAEGLTWLDRDAALERLPILNPDYVAAAYHDPHFHDIEVDALLQGYLKGVRRGGGSLRLKAGILAARHDGHRWQIETAAGALTADILVNAAGAWADSLAVLAGVQPLPVTPLRRTAILVDLPEGMESAGMPEVNEVADDFYFKPDGGRLFVSPADEHPSPACDAQPKEIDIAWAAHHLETATTLSVRRVAKSWAGLRSFTPDRLPAVGFDPAQPAFFWLVGQGGYGILTSPALGSLSAGLLLGAAPDALSTAFSPARFR